MREVKFRAWEKTLNEIIPVLNVDFDKQIINKGSAWRFFKEIELMQYTGLKDMNGVEIYEGDLVEHEMEVNGLWEPYEACEVVFDEGCGIYCFEWDSPNPMSVYRNLKVIGNIYENPELSEESK